MSARFCIHCPNPAARGDRCWTHLKRAQRGQPVASEVRHRRRDPMDALIYAALAFAVSKQDCAATKQLRDRVYVHFARRKRTR